MSYEEAIVLCDKLELWRFAGVDAIFCILKQWRWRCFEWKYRLRLAEIIQRLVLNQFRYLSITVLLNGYLIEQDNLTGWTHEFLVDTVERETTKTIRFACSRNKVAVVSCPADGPSTRRTSTFRGGTSWASGRSFRYGDIYGFNIFVGVCTSWSGVGLTYILGTVGSLVCCFCLNFLFSSNIFLMFAVCSGCWKHFWRVRNPLKCSTSNITKKSNFRLSNLNISKSWRDRQILWLDSDFALKITMAMTPSCPTTRPRRPVLSIINFFRTENLQFP